MTTNTPVSKPGHLEAFSGPRDDLDPLLETELVVDDGAADLGGMPRLHAAGPAPDPAADEAMDG
ncbi:hypothetical protein ACFY5D_17600 [Paeniglutamicibacter sp. NPDC012692]|uniref:hypothetical protein n=1 Tax=Paeniglutamicibacter sp. NPDC012692 TaxID=3364388 RepID=UPI0036995173